MAKKNLMMFWATLLMAGAMGEVGRAMEREENLSSKSVAVLQQEAMDAFCAHIFAKTGKMPAEDYVAQHPQELAAFMDARMAATKKQRASADIVKVASPVAMSNMQELQAQLKEERFRAELLKQRLANQELERRLEAAEPAPDDSQDHDDQAAAGAPPQQKKTTGQKIEKETKRVVNQLGDLGKGVGNAFKNAFGKKKKKR